MSANRFRFTLSLLDSFVGLALAIAIATWMVTIPKPSKRFPPPLAVTTQLEFDWEFHRAFFCLSMGCNVAIAALLLIVACRACLPSGYQNRFPITSGTVMLSPTQVLASFAAITLVITIFTGIVSGAAIRQSVPRSQTLVRIDQQLRALNGSAFDGYDELFIQFWPTYSEIGPILKILQEADRPDLWDGVVILLPNLREADLADLMKLGGVVRVEKHEPNGRDAQAQSPHHIYWTPPGSHPQ